jgi:hypothetical protein
MLDLRIREKRAIRDLGRNDRARAAKGLDKMIVKLDNEQVLFVQNWAARKNEYNQKRGIVNQKESTQHPDYIQYKGKAGEAAFGLAFDLKTDWGIHAWGDGGIDFQGKVSIDVKTTESQTLELVFKPGTFRANVGVLVQMLAIDRFYIHGWITHNEFRNKCYTNNYGWDAVKPTDLRPIELLKGML